MTQEQINELRKLEQTAVEGPWDAVIQDSIGRMRIESEGCIIAEYIDADDAAFIAAAREAVPKLIQQRDELLRIASDAATSLETIHIRSFGDDSYLNHPDQMRAYAGSRAGVVRKEIKDVGIES